MRIPKIIFVSLISLLFYRGLTLGEATKTVYNPFTGKLDYITKVSSDSLPGGSTQYIQNTNTLQSGAMFFVSSGTVEDRLDLNGDVYAPSSVFSQYFGPGPDGFLRTSLADVFQTGLYTYSSPPSSVGQAFSMGYDTYGSTTNIINIGYLQSFTPTDIYSHYSVSGTIDIKASTDVYPSLLSPVSRIRVGNNFTGDGGNASIYFNPNNSGFLLQESTIAFSNGASVDWKTAGALNFNGCKVGIGTTTPSVKLHIVGAGAQLRLQDPATTRAVTLTAAADGDITIETSLANLVIQGTTATGPVIDYDVNANAAETTYRFGSGTMSTGFTSGIYTGTVMTPGIANDSGTHGYTVLKLNPIETSLTGSGLRLVQDWQVNSVSRMVFNASGQLGIGVTSPECRLHVSTSSALVDSIGAVFQNNGGLGSSSSIHIAASDFPLVRASVIRSINMGAANHQDMAFLTSRASAVPDEKMRITNTGNVGIGTTIPRSALDVFGVIISTDGTMAAPGYAFSGATNTGMRRTVGGSLATVVGGVDINYYNVSGFQSGITGSASNPSFSMSGDANTGLYYPVADSIGLTTNATERIRISTGVGIGVTAPTAVLHLKAGTASAETAPLKFTTGVLLTTPEPGTLEYLSTTFYIRGSDNLNVAGFVTSGKNLTIGSGGAGVDYVLNLDGESNDGQIKYWEDENVVAISSMAYGSFYATNISSTIVVLAADTAYRAGGFTAGTMNGFTMSGSTALICQVAGYYQVTWNLSIDASGANDELEGGIYLKDVAQSNGTSHTTVPAASLGTTIAASAIVYMTVNDWIGLFIRNHTNVDDVVIEHANLTLLRVGG